MLGGSYSKHASEVAEDPGFLLVQAGLVRDDQLLTAREARAQGGGTLGEHLVMAGAVDDDTLTEFYASKLVIPRVPADALARIPTAVLKRIPADMAAEFRVVPVAADGELNLTLAMSDPADKHVTDEIAFFIGGYVVRAVATQMQIAWCLAHYYGVMTPLARAQLVDGGGGVGDLETIEERAASRRDTSDDITPTQDPLFAPGTPWEVEEEEETGPARMPIQRRLNEERRISELAPRSGTLDVADPPREPERLPAVVVDDDELTGRRDFVRTQDGGGDGEELYEGRDTDLGEDDRTDERRPGTEPILLDRPSTRRQAVGTPAHIASGSGEILLLDQLKERRRSPSPQTEPGLGRFGSVDSHAQASHDTGASHGNPWADNEGENDTVRRQSKADRRGRRSRGQATTDPGEAATDPMHQPSMASAPANNTPPDAAPRSRGDSNADESAESLTDPGEVTTDPMRRMGGGNARAEWNVDDGWDMDDGWGPPGTTIPPGFLGAMPEEDDEDGARTPAPLAPPRPLSSGADPSPPGNSVDDSAVAAASAAAARVLANLPPRNNSAGVAAASASPEPEESVDPAVLAAELERSSNRLLETLRSLERAAGRDEIVDILLDHLGASLRRRAFFAVKGGVLFAFRQYGSARPGIGTAELSLDQPSTFGQVAMNRMPYRGTLSPAAIEFVERALGSAGKGEAIVLPVVVKGRAVGLLYGDGLSARLFDEHQMVLGRAAGQAFERILATRAARN